MEVNPALFPVRTRAGALGGGLPRQDMLVSQQHRLLIRNRVAERMTGSAEALVAAKHLVGLPGVEIVQEAESVTYVHFMCDRHELVIADGARAETLYLGPEARKMLSAALCRKSCRSSRSWNGRLRGRRFLRRCGPS